MASKKSTQSIIGIILSIILIAIAFILIRPILFAILWGFVLAYMFYPLFIKINSLIKQRALSAFFILLVILIIIFLLLWFIVPLIVKQTFGIYAYLQKVDWSSQIKKLIPALSEQSLKDFTIAINNFFSKISKSALNGLVNIILNLPIISLHIFIAAVIFFFALKDGDKLKEYVKGISPLSKSTEEQFFKKFRDITYSVVYGQFIVGLVQGLVTGVGLFVFGVPNAVLLTIIAIFLSILPIVGPMIIWIPASIYLILTGHIGAGIGFFIYGTLVISWIDNVTRSFIISKQVKMHPALVWVGMIGGLIVFGVLGFIIGPLILAYLILIIDFYKQGKFRELFSK